MTTPTPHTCKTQCDNCHTNTNCVESEFTYNDLLLCSKCWDSAYWIAYDKHNSRAPWNR